MTLKLNTKCFSTFQSMVSHRQLLLNFKSIISYNLPIYTTRGSNPYTKINSKIGTIFPEIVELSTNSASIKLNSSLNSVKKAHTSLHLLILLVKRIVTVGLMVWNRNIKNMIKYNFTRHYLPSLLKTEISKYLQ